MHEAVEAADRHGCQVAISMFPGTLVKYAAAMGKGGGLGDTQPGTEGDAQPGTEGKSGGLELRTFDWVSCLLVLCSVPDEEAALLSCSQILKHGTGQLLFLEHVVASSSFGRWLQRAVQPLWNLIGDG
ncbi:hypothetical protein T492DRAFT_1032730 [Pavlovales sp. CCMP2436]|nr:hypothetical protein T492DRAFT_1032730 [Pavlovales sp. CCMP2436]